LAGGNFSEEATNDTCCTTATALETPNGDAQSAPMTRKVLITREVDNRFLCMQENNTEDFTKRKNKFLN
jgi:hypothetical protein